MPSAARQRRPYRFYKVDSVNVPDGEIGLIPNPPSLGEIVQVPDTRIGRVVDPLLPTFVHAYHINHEMVEFQTGRVGDRRFTEYLVLQCPLR